MDICSVDICQNTQNIWWNWLLVKSMQNFNHEYSLCKIGWMSLLLLLILMCTFCVAWHVPHQVILKLFFWSSQTFSNQGREPWTRIQYRRTSLFTVLVFVVLIIPGSDNRVKPQIKGEFHSVVFRPNLCLICFVLFWYWRVLISLERNPCRRILWKECIQIFFIYVGWMFFALVRMTYTFFRIEWNVIRN